MNRENKRPKTLWAYAMKYRWRYLFVLVTLLIAVGLNAMIPMIIGKIMDEVVVGGKTGMLIGLLVELVALGLAHAFFNYVKEFTSDGIGISICCDLRRDLFAHIQSLSADFFGRTNTGELMARVKDDVDKVQFVMGFAGMLMFECVIHTAVSLFCMVKISPLLTVLPVTVMAVVGFVAVRMERRLGKCYGDISNENAELTTIAQENLAGVRTVKAFSREAHEIEKFMSRNKRYYELNIGMANVFIGGYPIINVASRILAVLTIVGGGIMVITKYDGMTLGGLAAYNEYVNGVMWPMECLGWLSSELASAIASHKKIKAIMTERPMIESPENAVRPEHVEGRVTFESVGFRVADTDILRDVSFDLPAGGTIGIMGMTGSGKSTLINLLERFWDVSGGSVRLDGVDVRSLDLETLRDSISVVSQDVFLFSDSIEENIKLGSGGSIDDESMECASRAACASEFIDKLGERYGTIIGERGVGLSGGQKQRISIARALAKKAPVLVLDDATSALDMETEQAIQRTLDSLEGVTKIIIAHRISAVRRADEIIVLEDGAVAERGTHDELMRLGGRYRETYAAQYGDMDGADDVA